MSDSYQRERGISRRAWLAGSIGAGIGLASSKIWNMNMPSCYRRVAIPRTPEEQLQAVVQNYRLVGRPISKASVLAGLHPIPVERVVILEQERVQGSKECNGLCCEIQPWMSPIQGEETRVEHIRLAIEMLIALTDYYGLPNRLENWTKVMGTQKEWGRSIEQKGIVLTEPFTRHGISHTANPPVDWWLFLFPGGLQGCHHTESCEDSPLQMVLLRVLSGASQIHHSSDGIFLAHLMFRIRLGAAKWHRASQMAAADAAQFVNRQIIHSLPFRPHWTNA